ncbi:MAG: exo-beta-N-acetylmuramidase NamZ domain-containing protein, partial [Terriglobales bacterium]
RPDLDLTEPWQGRDEALRRVWEEKAAHVPGENFVYSDINFIVLGLLVERVSGMSLDQYAEANILRPLGMAQTRFLPPAQWGPHTAPTEPDEGGEMLRGVVHDPTARRMGGVAGHAGLFGTADDVARFAQALLDGGDGVLKSETVALMTTPQQPPGASARRGLGWDIESPYSSPRGDSFPIDSFGHTGFTGTSVWIDSKSQTYIVLLTNVVHPKGGKSAKLLRSNVANAVASALGLHTSAGRRVETGIDVLEERKFDALRAPDGKQRRTGVLTNQTGRDSQGRRTIDVLAAASGVKLTAIFAPEHGATGDLDTADIAHSRDAATGVPVYSVYGATDAQRRPPLEVMKTLDAVVIDLQDVGVRFYTYATTTGYFLEAAAQTGTDIIVLDRPNPITGSIVQGPLSDAGKASFINYHALPVRHGMTLGELARLFNTERGINAKLTVVPMENWERGDWFDKTGLAWVNPSPNLRSLTQATLYPGVAMVEWSNVSVGRGTDAPFEQVGAPWVDGARLADYLNQRQIPGVRFAAADFTPTSSRYAGQACRGVRITLMDRKKLDAPLLGVELMSALLRLFPADYKLERTSDLLANARVMEGVTAGRDPRAIAQQWRAEVQKFVGLRREYLLY